jgi:UDP-glucose 4-epimerase
MTKILVTGANGFVGRALCDEFVRKGYRVRAVVRDVTKVQVSHGVEIYKMGHIDSSTDWSGALDGVDKVVHLAARVHVMNEVSKDPLDEFRRVNTEGTRQLAHSAARAGVRRLLYMSTIKVNGEETTGRPFTEEDSPIAEDPYAVSKWEAEQSLDKIGKETGLEVVVIRPPLVYGPAVKGNFLRLLKWVDLGIPLPFGSVANRRSLIGLHNLVDLIERCVEHPAAVGETFLASDGEDLSTSELIRRIAYALGQRPHIISFPVGILRRLMKLIGYEEIDHRLLGSLQIDSSKVRTLLGWSPPRSVDEELSRTVEWYCKIGR